MNPANFGANSTNLGQLWRDFWGEFDQFGPTLVDLGRVWSRRTLKFSGITNCGPRGSIFDPRRRRPEGRECKSGPVGDLPCPSARHIGFSPAPAGLPDGPNIKETFFGDIRRRILKYLDDIQVQQQREIPKGLAETTRDTRDDDEGGSDSDEDGECVDPDDPVAQERKAERLRRHLEQKWSFPDVPGRRAAPDSVELEFMRALITIFTLEDTLTDEV